MRRLWQVTRLIWAADGWAMWRGAAAALAVLAMGAALLGLSGWFITASGLAGLAGIGVGFDFFRPSAGVRGLALGRAGARYAERLLTHDATLRALTRLRLVLMRRLEGWPMARLRRLRGSSELMRITADVDALDGLVLRLVLPMAAGVLMHGLVFAVLAWLTTVQIAVAVAAGYLGGGALVLGWVARRALGPSAQAERQRQAMRRGVIGLFRGHRAAIVEGRLATERAGIAAEEAAWMQSAAGLDRIDRWAGLALYAVVVLVAAATLALGGAAVQGGALGAAPAAIGVFVALALAETLLPLRRGLAELGRMHDAAGRVIGEDGVLPVGGGEAVDRGAGLVLEALGVTAEGRGVALIAPLSLRVAASEAVALAGPSGVGKSTVLDAVAGVTPPLAGRVAVLGRTVADWDEAALRRHLTLVPQRAVLMGGSIRENLALARDNLDEDAAWAALRAVALDGVVERIGGLDAVLREGGEGLSGGEARRLALARAVLRQPDVLLLDEPTEGLDDALAREVLAGIRAALPGAAILMASHRQAELEFADRVIGLERPRAP